MKNNNLKIGVIGPSENEVMPFIQNMYIDRVTKVAMLDFYQGSFCGNDVIALYSGVCKVNAAIAAQTLINKFEVTHIIVVGVAGGLDKVLKIGDTVIGTEVGYHDVADGILTEYHPWMKSIYFKSDDFLIELSKKIVVNNKFFQNVFFGKIVTGEAFITHEGRTEIVNKHHPLCVDMETASIAHVCFANDIPFLAIRSISDTEEESGLEVFEENCVNVALNSIDVLKAIIKELKNPLV